ncbi:MAG: hypothetical protein RL033_3661 [Pseudomonadota bacterium]|jgi:hypothetical protein
MLKVWSRLSLVLLLLLLGASRPTSIGSDSSSAELIRVGSSSAATRGNPSSSAPAEAASTLELDGLQDDVVDLELALPPGLSTVPASALQKQHAELGVGARRAVVDAPFKPPNR